MQQAIIPMEKICAITSVLVAEVSTNLCGTFVGDDLYQIIEDEFEEVIW